MVERDGTLDMAADCLRIITRAEMRMADEIDKIPSAQGRRSDFAQNLGEVNPTYSELNLDRRRLSDWR